MTSGLRRLSIWATSGSAWPLATFLAIGMLLRIPAIWLADGHEFVDQSFQYIDPAWHLATGLAWHPTWEWEAGMRSWTYPGLLAGILRGLMFLGIEEPFRLMRAVRAVHAVISLLPLWLFWLAIVRWRPIASPRLPLLLFAGSGFLVTTGVQPSGPAFGATLAIAAVLAFHGPRWFPALAGLLLGLAFCGRVQETLFGPALAMVGIWQRRPAAVLWLIAGCVPGLLLLGFVDYFTLGGFFSSPWAYFDANILQGAASKFGQRPWWFYLVAGVVPVAVLVPPWLRIAANRLAIGARLLPGAAAAAALHLLVHSCIARKALRFEYASLGLLVAVVAAGIGAASTSERWSLGYRRAVAVVQIGLFVWASFLFGNAGAIRAANALRLDPEFAGELLVVDGDVTSMGGAYYLRQPTLHVTGVSPAEVAAHVARVKLPSGSFIVAVENPLDEAALGDAGRLRPVAEFTGMFDLRRGDRRFLYRLER